jgi:excisionase family DNA binding protein
METNLVLTSIPLTEIENRIADIVDQKFRSILSGITQLPPNNLSSEFLSRKDTAKLLGVSLVTLNEWTKTGKVQGYRIASRVRFKRAEVEASLQKINTGKR